MKCPACFNELSVLRAGSLNVDVASGAQFNLIPTGAIMAFNLSTCPAGWSAADGAGGNAAWLGLEDRDGNYWIGSPGGLTRYRPGHTPPRPPRITVLANKAYDEQQGVADELVELDRLKRVVIVAVAIELPQPPHDPRRVAGPEPVAEVLELLLRRALRRRGIARPLREELERILPERFRPRDPHQPLRGPIERGDAVVAVDGDHRLAQAVQDRREHPLPGEDADGGGPVQQFVAAHASKCIRSA